MHTSSLSAALLLAALSLQACAKSQPSGIEGYAEGDYLYISAQAPGEIATLDAQEGTKVAAGALLFTLDDTRQKAALNQASEALAEAQAGAALAAQTYARTKKLTAEGRTPQAQLDQASADLNSSNARVDQASAQLTSAQQDLADRTVAAPAAGSIEEVYHRAGERVAANEPVLALLPPANIKVRFFVPEAMLSRLKLGEQVTVGCDACAQPIGARVSFIANAAQFTPPFIYSREEREKLVYLIEARPDRPQSLRPGQPVEVSVAP